MALGFLLKEIGKVVVVGAANEIIREKVIPPVAEKVKKKIEEWREDSESEEEESLDIKEYTAKWQ